MPIILGIDPGTTDVGFAVIELQKNQRTILTYGVIHTTPKVPQTQKLVEIMKDLDEIIRQHNVTHAAIEKLFFSTNLKTGIDVAQSRGVIMVTIGNHGIPILEYTPLQVKKSHLLKRQGRKKTNRSSGATPLQTRYSTKTRRCCRCSRNSVSRLHESRTLPQTINTLSFAE
jgi:crossover junction endodeoxyribonuclease RuvC